MSVSQQKAKVLSMQNQRKERGEKLDWNDQAAVQSFNAFQDSLKREEQNLAALEKKAREKKDQGRDWDFDGDWD